MGFLGLCKDDAVVGLLHEHFGANVLRVPEQRVQPLTVVSRRKGKRAFRGQLEHLLAEGDLADLPVHPSAMGEISGKKTRSVDVDVGLDLLGGFLSGFGVPSAGIGTHVQGAQEVAFTFADVERRWIDPGLLGRRLDHSRIDPHAAAAAIYFADPPWQLLVVDSVITSNHFTMSVVKSSGEDVHIDVPAIQQIVGDVKAKVTVSSSASSQVSFAGRQRLTFAFTLQRAYLEPDGRVSTLDPDDALLSRHAAEGDVVPVPPRVRLSPEPVLLEWDEADDGVEEVVGARRT